MIKNNETDINELAVRILYGVSKALRKLVETAAVNNENLIIGDKDGTIRSVPAKKLLKDLSKKRI